MKTNMTKIIISAKQGASQRWYPSCTIFQGVELDSEEGEDKFDTKREADEYMLKIMEQRYGGHAEIQIE
jgi:hypothetical protein